MTFIIENVLLIGAILIFVSILVSKRGFKYGVPTLLIFLLVGMIFGVDGVGIHFNDYRIAQFVGTIALSVILFAGGMDTQFSSIKSILYPGIVLSTVGVLLTTIFTGLFIWGVSFMFNFSTEVSLLFALLLAATMSSTDSASVFNILRSQKIGLRNNLKPLLELESGSNDPMAYMLTIVLIQIIMNGGSHTMSVWEILLMFVLQFIVGAGLGVILGKLGAWFINRVNLPNRALYPILVVSFIFFIFSITNLLKGNGFLAVYLAGIIMGNQRLVASKKIDAFLNGIVWLLQIIMFLMLGLLVNPHEMIRVAIPAIIIAVFMIFVGRPLSVFLSLIPFRKINFKDQLFVSWVGLRGAAPIIFSISPVVAGVEGASIIFNVVFFITLISLILQGTTIPLVARWLHLEEQTDDSPANFGVEIPEELNTILKQEIVDKDALLKDYPLPLGSLVVIVKRNHKYIVPNGKLMLHQGDKLLLISEKEQETEKKLLTELEKSTHNLFKRKQKD